MQVILVKPVRKLGKIGETVNVANGYGRNYLIPQEFAIRANKENIEKLATIKKDLETKNSKKKAEAEKAAKSMEGKHINFIAQSAADGRLFGSVTAKNLAVKISELAGITLNYSNILIDSPIKFNGVYDIQIILHPEIITTVVVIVAKSEPEAQDALREYQENGEKKKDELKQADTLDSEDNKHSKT